MDLGHMREDYNRGELDTEAAASAPVEQFERWFTDAVKAKIPEPNAMTLATVGADGRPSTRVVLMKEFDTAGVVFYTNYTSRKANDLDAHPVAALQFFWPTLHRVVRIEGRVTKVTSIESDTYFAARPIDSRLGAWASPQSQPIASRAVLLANAAKASARFGLKPPRPEWWGGYRLAPDYWEFWQGRTSRLHDRVRYRLIDDVWRRDRLAP